MRDYYYKTVYPFLKQFETGIVVNEDGRRKHDLTKKYSKGHVSYKNG